MSSTTSEPQQQPLFVTISCELCTFQQQITDVSDENWEGCGICGTKVTEETRARVEQELLEKKGEGVKG